MNFKCNLSCILILLFTFACSMEDEFVLSDIENGIVESEGNKTEFYIDVNINPAISVIPSKTGDKAIIPSDEIHNTVFFLFEGDVVKNVGVYRKSDTESEPATPSYRFYAKKNADLSVYAIANVSDKGIEELKKQTSYINIRKVPLSDISSDQTYLPKAPFTKTKPVGEGRPAEVMMQLDQLTSHISVESLNYVMDQGILPEDFRLTEIAFLNRVVNQDLDGGNLTVSDDPLTFSYDLAPDGNNFNIQKDNEYPGCFVYPNENVNYKTSVKLSFLYGGKTITATVPLKTTSGESVNEVVHPGYYYKLNLTVRVDNSNIEASVEAIVLPWLDYGEIDLGEIEAG